MSRVRSRDTAPEMQLRRALHAAGMRYRLSGALPGRPDLVFTRARIAVFIDGCYWHGCPVHATRPKTNAAWWAAKLDRNIERDCEVNAALRAEGWQVIRVWAHELLPGKQQNVARVVARVKRVLQRRMQ